VFDDVISVVDLYVEVVILVGLWVVFDGMMVVVVVYCKGIIVLVDDVVFIENGRVVDYGIYVELMVCNEEYCNFVEVYECEVVECELVEVDEEVMV